MEACFSFMELIMLIPCLHFFSQMRERWMENYYVMRDQGPLSGISYPMRIFIGWIVHYKISQRLHGQGTGRYTSEEFYSLREEAWTALDKLVAEIPFREGAPHWILGGKNPTEADACLYGFLVSALISPA